MKPNTIRSLLASAVLVAPLVAHAQAKAPAPAATPAPAAAPAPVNVTPEARAAIKELLDTLNTKEQLTRAFGGVAQSLVPQMAAGVGRQIENYPGLTADQKMKVREGMNAPFEAAVKEAQSLFVVPKLVDDAYDKLIVDYAGRFTTPEIRQLTAFYKSPLGQKAWAQIPQANGETLQQVGQQAAQQNSPRIAAMIEKAVKTQADAVLAQSSSAPAKK